MERLDNYLAKIKNLSRTRAQELIKNEKVLVDGKSITKPSFLVDNAIVEIKEEENYVSRGAYKLKKALDIIIPIWYN